MTEEQKDVKNVDEQATRLFKNPLEKICELSSYNGYRTFYLEPGDGYNIGSLFAFPKSSVFEQAKSFREMIVRQNTGEMGCCENKDEILKLLPQFQSFIDDIKETKGPAFMPILPSISESGADFQNLDRQAIYTKQLKYENIHEQIVNSFDMARFQISRLTKKDVPQNWFLFGREKTSKGLFRLWSLCPEKTSAICCNNCIDDIVLPVTSHKNEQLIYPEGFSDYKDITNIEPNNQEMLSKYRNTDVLYIGNSFDFGKQKHEEQIKAKLKKLKFPHFNIERFDGTRIVDFGYFYQFRSEIYKQSILGKIFGKIIGGRKNEVLLLSSPADNASIPITSEQSQYFGQLSEEEMEQYINNLQNINKKPSSGIAKVRLSKVMTYNADNDKVLGG